MSKLVVPFLLTAMVILLSIPAKIKAEDDQTFIKNYHENMKTILEKSMTLENGTACDSAKEDMIEHLLRYYVEGNDKDVMLKAFLGSAKDEKTKEIEKITNSLKETVGMPGKLCKKDFSCTNSKCESCVEKFEKNAINNDPKVYKACWLRATRKLPENGTPPRFNIPFVLMAILATVVTLLSHNLF